MLVIVLTEPGEGAVGGAQGAVAVRVAGIERAPPGLGPLTVTEDRLNLMQFYVRTHTQKYLYM